MDGTVHALGVTLAAVASVTLIGLVLTGGDGVAIGAAVIYCLGMLATFGFSAAYNMIQRPGWKEVLRRCDHAAIYLMIAGTYTPFALAGIGGAVGYGLLALVWGVALFGLVLKIAFPRRFERLSLVLYLAMGWAGLLVLDAILQALPVSALVFLAVGGVFYTVGVLFHLSTRLLFHNAIWHAFVLIAAGFHYAAVLEAVGVV